MTITITIKQWLKFKFLGYCDCTTLAAMATTYQLTTIVHLYFYGMKAIIVQESKIHQTNSTNSQLHV